MLPRGILLWLAINVVLLDNLLYNVPLRASAHEFHATGSSDISTSFRKHRKGMFGGNHLNEENILQAYTAPTRDTGRVPRVLQETETETLTKESPCAILTRCSECAGSADVKVILGRLNTSPSTDVQIYFLTKAQYDPIKNDCGDPEDYIRDLGTHTDWGRQEYDLGSAVKDEGSDSDAPYVYVKARQTLLDDEKVELTYTLQYKVSNGSSKTGLIVGVVVGVLVVGIAIGLLGLCYWRQKQDEDPTDEDSDWESHDIFSQTRETSDLSQGKSTGPRVRNNVAWINRSGHEVRNPLPL
eukprot:gb/GECG01016549.1/.p1 GENE.gb/GECG01016549.1/~~gb/GECG01016549.1/.p1  ORF type:complete len:298 (+),score=24.41 gb/GECG01016549.1/:1-894(+)